MSQLSAAAGLRWQSIRAEYARRKLARNGYGDSPEAWAYRQEQKDNSPCPGKPISNADRIALGHGRSARTEAILAGYL